MSSWNTVLEALWGAARVVLPKCSCGRPSLPVACISCQCCCCEQHAWVNPATLRVLCSSCVAQTNGPWNEPIKPKQPKQSRTVPKTIDCWKILGIRLTDDEGIVQKAFRKQAKKHHPDHGGDPQKFMDLQRAREEALRRIRENV
jgi:hypothetical protein